MPFVLPSFSLFCCFYHDCTFHTFPLQFTSDIIGVVDRAMELIRIRRAATAAIKFGKTFPALIFCIYIAALEFVSQFRILDSIINIAHQELLHTYKLMAGIQIAPGRHGQIFRTGTTAGQPLEMCIRDRSRCTVLASLFKISVSQVSNWVSSV